MYLDDKLVDSAAKIVVAMYGAASGASCLQGIRLCGVHSLDAEQKCSRQSLWLRSSQCERVGGFSWYIYGPEYQADVPSQGAQQRSQHTMTVRVCTRASCRALFLQWRVGRCRPR